MVVENLKYCIAYLSDALGNSTTALLLLCAVLVSCGGGGGPGGQPPPSPAPGPVTYDLIFPSAVSLTGAKQISIVGAADAGRVDTVTIKSGNNRTVAQLDSFGHWRATDVALVAGSNPLTVELVEQNGNVTELAIANIHSSPILSNPTGALFDPTNNRVLILDAKQLLSFSLATGELEILSAPEIGDGPGFSLSRDFALLGDGAILVSDFRGIVRVDPTTGDRSEHVLLPTGSGPIATVAYDKQQDRLFAVGLFGDLYVADLATAPPILATTIKPLPGFVFAAGGLIDSVYVTSTDSIYKVNFSSLEVVKVDANTGDSQPIVLDFGGFVTPTVGIDYEDAAARLLVLGSSGAVFSLDPIAETSGLLQAPSITSTVPTALSGMSIGNDKFWSVSQLPGELRSIEIGTGLQSVEANSQTGDGAPPGPMLTGRYDAASDRFIAVADFRIVAIDPKTGSRQHLAFLQDPTTFPLPPSFLVASGLALSPDGTRAWVSSLFNQTVVEANLVTGEVHEVSSPNVGAGPLPDQISGIAVDSKNSVAYLSDRFTQRIFRVDLATGQRNLLADLATMLNLGQLRSLALDSASNRLLLNIAPLTPSSALLPTIYALDLATLDLTPLADLTAVELPFGETTTAGFLTPQMSLSVDASSLYTPISGNADVPYARIDLASGDVLPLGSASSGVPFFIPNAIDVSADNRLFALDGTGALLIVDPETGERSIVSK
jgi:hypothetical protein